MSRNAGNWKRLILCVIMCSIMSLLSACTSKDALRRVVREDPSIVMDVLRENRMLLLETVQSALAEQDALTRLQDYEKQLESPLKPVLQGDRPMLGNPLSTITVVEYSDLLCPYCGRGSATVLELLKRHPDKLRVFFKHFPLHQDSEKLAAIFEAVARQDQQAAWKYKELVFAVQKAVLAEGADGPAVCSILGGLGLDADKILATASDASILERVRSDAEEARSFGFGGTPTYLINGVAIRGAVPFAELEDVLGLVQRHGQGVGECTDCVK